KQHMGTRTAQAPPPIIPAAPVPTRGRILALVFGGTKNKGPLTLIPSASYNETSYTSLRVNVLRQLKGYIKMADRNARGALQLIKTPDYEAMVIGAHPDDDDFGAGGTSALWAKQGKKIVWVVMTDGTEGSEVPALIDTEFMLTREQEQRMACETLGVQAVEFLRFPDGHLTNN